jgi:Fic family protein
MIKVAKKIHIAKNDKMLQYKSMFNQKSTRAGSIRRQPSGYDAFIPVELLPLPEINIDAEILELVSEASIRLGRLDGIGRNLPNPELFISIFVRQEALLSSQIEGTQCTLDDILNFPIEPQKEDEDIKEVINYVEAMKYGLARLPLLPLSRRLLCEIHEVLLCGSRGKEKTPGQVRKSQNWIKGTSPADAHYVPPPVYEMENCLADFEKFLHVKKDIIPLIQVAIAHAQFESIHPFLDGNGRLGRLLITLFLCERQMLSQPLLYLSHFLKGNQFEYYRKLDAIRQDGDWEGWIKFFLNGVIRVSDQAIKNAENLTRLSVAHHQLLRNNKSSNSALQLLDYLYEQPAINVGMVEKQLGCAYATAKSAIKELEDLGLLKETTGFKRNKRYEYAPYLAFWREAEDDFSDIDPENISRERFAKAIESLRSKEAAVSISSEAPQGQWIVTVNKVEVCMIDQWTYDKVMGPLKNYSASSLEEKKVMEAEFFVELADELERISSRGPEPEFDRATVYEIQAMSRVALGHVYYEADTIHIDFVGGDVPGLMSDAMKIPIPWAFLFISDEGKRTQKKIAKVTQYGMSEGMFWMKIVPTDEKPSNAVEPLVEKTPRAELASYYLVIDGTEGKIKLRPLMFYHNILEMAYNVPGLESWSGTNDKVQSMKEALERLNTKGRFEIFAYPDEREDYVKAVPEELKKQAKEMAGL